MNNDQLEEDMVIEIQLPFKVKEPITNSLDLKNIHNVFKLIK